MQNTFDAAECCVVSNRVQSNTFRSMLSRYVHTSYTSQHMHMSTHKHTHMQSDMKKHISQAPISISIFCAKNLKSVTRNDYLKLIAACKHFYKSRIHWKATTMMTTTTTTAMSRSFDCNCNVYKVQKASLPSISIDNTMNNSKNRIRDRKENKREVFSQFCHLPYFIVSAIAQLFLNSTTLCLSSINFDECNRKLQNLKRMKWISQIFWRLLYQQAICLPSLFIAKWLPLVRTIT